MKRWPQVSSPAVRWPNLNGTTWPSKTQRIECSGRTQRRALLPQRIDFGHGRAASARSEEHTSELQSLMRISYAVFCLKKKKLQKERQVTILILKTTEPIATS